MVTRDVFAELLTQAQAEFEAEILPAVPRESRYTALMIARAMTIAVRGLERGAAPLREARALLAAHYGERPEEAGGGGLEGQLAAYGKRLAAEIRAGRCDGKGEVATLLRDLTRLELAATNPRLLSAASIQESPSHGN